MRAAIPTRRIALAALSVSLGVAMRSTVAPADAATWEPCSKAAGDAAARSAGLSRALDRDRGLRRVFPDVQPSRVYKTPSASLCGDVDRDGDGDRAVHYQWLHGLLAGSLGRAPPPRLTPTASGRSRCGCRQGP